MSANWENKLSNGGLPFVTVACKQCKGSATVDQVRQGMTFSHCGRADAMPQHVFDNYAQAMANFKAGKSAAEKGAVRYI